MKQKPWPIIFLSLLHIVAPFGNLFLNSFRHHISAVELFHLWLANIQNPIVMINFFVPPLAGIMIYLCRSWSYKAYLFFISVLLASSCYNLYNDFSWVNVIYLLAVLTADVLIVSYFLIPIVKQIYFDPRLRWWETAPRFSAGFQAKVKGYSEYGEVVNISIGGMFLKTPYALSDFSQIEVHFNYQNFNYSVVGSVVHHRKMDVHGYGVQFGKHPETSEKDLKKLMAQLKSEGRQLVDRSPAPNESFVAWVKRLVTTGQGFVPEVKTESPQKKSA